MPPVRSKPSPAEPSTSTSKPHPKRPHKRSHPAPADNAAPGVQKLKAALRQTRRLLAREGLAADARVTAERRLRALEGELEGALRARREREMAVRYHKVKFFERQKVTRKIAQTKRTLGAPDLGKKERRALEKTLFELRVDLNYIMHYPKMEKYVSLFPPAARGKGVDEATAHEQEKTDKRREEVRAEVRAAMEEGRLSGEPEAESRAKGVVHADKGKRAVLGDGESARATKKARGEGTMGKSIEKVGKAAPAGDEFFEAASDGDEGNEPSAGEGTGEGDDSGEDDDDESKMDDRE